MIAQGPDPVPEPTADAFAPVLPPRPNLGPEPWREPIGPGPWAALAAVVLLLAAWGLVRRARRRGRPSGASRPGAPLGPARGREAPTPADRPVARAEAVRDALVAALGPGWAARTTEEVAEAPELADRIGPGRASWAVALLTEADRAKFAGGVPPEDPEAAEVADRRVAEVVEALAAARAASPVKGR